MTTKTVLEKEHVVVRFAGDSGDGMQLTGDRFTNATAVLGNDLATLPDFPAEIRAPAGTLAGVSAFQIHFAARDIVTPGDAPNVLVAMNPAALQDEHRATWRRAACSSSTRTRSSTATWRRPATRANPLDGRLASTATRCIRVPMTSITLRATEGIDITKKEAERAKNLFALGLLSWMYGRPDRGHHRLDREEVRARSRTSWRRTSRRSRPGYNFGETTELFAHTYEVKPAPAEPGHVPERQRAPRPWRGA